jgi:hypothetical protein
MPSTLLAVLRRGGQRWPEESLMDEKQRQLREVLARASTDPAFRRGLLSDPHRTLREACGIVVPATFRLRFIEREPGVDALIVLPDQTIHRRRA